MRSEEELVRAGYPVCESVAKKLTLELGAIAEYDEILAVGRVALLDAVRSYDPARGQFAPYIQARIRWAMLDSVRRDTRVHRLARRANGLYAMDRLARAGRHRDASSIEDPPTEDGQRQQFRGALGSHACALFLGLITCEGEAAEVTPEELLERERARGALRTALGSLDERHRLIIEAHYFRGEPFEGIAKRMQVSKSWLSRLHAKALTALGEALRGLR